jgi:hypothetical protein
VWRHNNNNKKNPLSPVIKLCIRHPRKKEKRKETNMSQAIFQVWAFVGQIVYFKGCKTNAAGAISFEVYPRGGDCCEYDREMTGLGGGVSSLGGAGRNYAGGVV